MTRWEYQWVMGYDVMVTQGWQWDQTTSRWAEVPAGREAGLFESSPVYPHYLHALNLAGAEGWEVVERCYNGADHLVFYLCKRQTS